MIPFRPEQTASHAYSRDTAVRQEALPHRRQTARELEEQRILEERRKRWEENVRRHAIRREIRTQYTRANGLTLRDAAMVAAASALLLTACIFFLWQESSVSRTARRINSLQSQYAELLTENDALSGDIGKRIDVEEIYRYAVEELNMTYPDQAHVLTFEHFRSVTQKEDIPEHQ